MFSIKKGDLVIVLTGRDKRKQGKVLKVFPAKNRALIEGVNLVSHYVRANPQQNVTGGIHRQEAPIHLSNLALYNPDTGKRDKVRIKTLENGKRIRVFRSNDQEVVYD
jgi:large subunit ribosomal protein L24